MLSLRSAFATYPHTAALKDGRVTSDRVAFDFEEVEPITRAFRRMVRTGDFDVCEIAVTTLAQAHFYRKGLTALPVVVNSWRKSGVAAEVGAVELPVAPIWRTTRSPGVKAAAKEEEASAAAARPAARESACLRSMWTFRLLGSVGEISACRGRKRETTSCDST